MRPIPQALKMKLLNRFKAASTDSEPAIRLVATQTSINTLLSEPIHEDIAPALGDVTVRQYIGEDSLSCAYAICLDEGTANIYRRQFPASMDYKWVYQWTFGSADDVAIEYDGTWVLDATNTWYYLRTEEFPYIFTVESGELYVQYWKDKSTRTLLASGVSQISSCKGWQNNIDIELDQGLIIGYIKSGEVYYRALCVQEDGTKIWEAEHMVTQLGQNNDTLSVIRTNDFRIGFLTENDGEMLLVLTYRNYAGMSVRPETLHVNVNTSFLFQKTVYKYGRSPRDYVIAGVDYPYFNLDTAPESEEISISSYEKLNYETKYYSYGVKLYFSKQLYGNLSQKFVKGAKLSVLSGTSTSAVAITSASFEPADNSITLLFASDIKRTCKLTLTTISIRTLWYYRVQNEKWFIPGYTVVFEPESIKKYGYAGREKISVETEAEFWVDKANFIYTDNKETISVRVVPTVVLAPVSSLPI